MTTRVINRNASLWASLKSTVSVAPFNEITCEGFHSFGIDAVTSVRNLISGKTPLSIIGNPLYGPNYIELSGAQVAYLVSSVKNSTDMTIIATAMPLEDKGVAIASNYQSLRADGTALCIGTQLGFNTGVSTTDNTIISTFNHGTLINGVSSGSEARTSTESPINKWYIISGRVKNANRTRRVDNITAGTSGTNTPVLNPVDLGDVMRYGSSYNAQYPGKVRLCELAIFSGYLSDISYSAAIEFMRESAVRKGVVF